MKGLSDLIIVLFLAIGLTIIALMGFNLASYQYQLYKQAVAQQEGRQVITELYDTISTRPLVGYSVRVPFKLSEGFLRFKAENIYMELTVDAGVNTYTLSPDVLGGASPIVYYEYGGEQPVTLDDAISYVRRGYTEILSTDIFRTINMFEYGQGSRMVIGVAWLPAIHLREETVGSTKRLVIVVIVPDVEDEVALSTTYSVGSEAAIQIVADTEVMKFTYSFNTPTAVTVSVKCWSDTVPAVSKNYVYGGISEVVVKVLRARINVDLYSG